MSGTRMAHAAANLDWDRIVRLGILSSLSLVPGTWLTVAQRTGALVI